MFLHHFHPGSAQLMSVTLSGRVHFQTMAVDEIINIRFAINGKVMYNKIPVNKATDL